MDNIIILSSWKIVCAVLFWSLAARESLSSMSVRKTNLDCDFESGTCGWRDTSKSYLLRWDVYSSRHSVNHFTGPLEDHTNGHGYYLAMMPGRAYTGGKAVIAGHRITTYQESCLTLWYYMHGYNVGSLNVYRIGQGHEKTLLFTMSGPQGRRWYRADIQTGTGTFAFQIEATSPQQVHHSDIAIDDVTFSRKPCRVDESENFKDKPHFDCDFELNLCGWYNLNPHGPLEWRRYTVSSDEHDRDALPPRSNGSSYARLLQHRTGRSGEFSLRSPALSLDYKPSCLMFWFKMEGEIAAVFRVAVVDYRQDYDDGMKRVFSTVPKAKGWTQAYITLPEAGDVFVDLEGVNEGWTRGTMAVDDIRLIRGMPCPKVNQEDLINCDFERDFCRWYMTTHTTEGDWIRTRDPTPTKETGPSHDHSGDGYYIFLDGSNVEVAQLHSPLFNVSHGGACLTFWTYMYGEDVYRLELVYKSYGDKSHIIWSLEGSQEDRWVEQNVSLHGNNDVDLIFKARRGYFPKSDIALDDISISFDGPCGSGRIAITTAASPINPEEKITPPMTTPKPTTPPPTTEPPPIRSSHVLAKGDTSPVYVNSRVELVCQQPDKSLVTRWYKQENFGGLEEGRPELIDKRGERTLMFHEIQMEDSGSYFCGVSRTSREDSLVYMSFNGVEINVVKDPRPIPALELTGEGSYTLGNLADVEVTVDVAMTCGHPIAGGVYHWNTTSPAFANATLPDTRILMLNDTKPDHTGSYSCRISKDGLQTAKSNELHVVVKEGKRCRYPPDCQGYAYGYDCGYNNRCWCARNAVVVGRVCKVKPESPNITTSPGFQEFGIGESFYLICNPRPPVFNNLTFTFRQGNRTVMTSRRILKVSNATENDSGLYVCSITRDGVTSDDSDAIDVQIRDFINLSCDFAKDFCGWSVGHEAKTTEFVAASNSGDSDSTNEPSGAFIQLVESKTTVPNRAVLVSPTIDRMTLDSCLMFWYRLHGTGVHSLSVWKFVLQILSYTESEHVGTEIWTTVGEKGEDWIKGNVTVEKGNDFYIAFDAIGQADIDDITFTYRGGC